MFDDFDVFDGVEAVTVRFPDTTEEPCDALWRQEVHRASGIKREARIHLRASDLSEMPPVGSVVIRSDTTLWPAAEVAVESLGARYVVTVADEVAASSDPVTLTFQDATTTKGASGAHEQTWADAQTLTGSFAPKTAERGGEYGERGLRWTYEATYLTDYEPGQNTRLVVDGTAYQIDKVTRSGTSTILEVSDFND